MFFLWKSWVVTGKNHHHCAWRDTKEQGTGPLSDLLGIATVQSRGLQPKNPSLEKEEMLVPAHREAKTRGLHPDWGWGSGVKGAVTPKIVILAVYC